MEKPKYKAGDVVHVRLDGHAVFLNNGGIYSFHADDIIAHIPAPEPVVRWVNVYECWVGTECSTREGADKGSRALDSKRTCILRLEWPDGDTSKKPVVTVEDV